MKKLAVLAAMVVAVVLVSTCVFAAGMQELSSRVGPVSIEAVLGAKTLHQAGTIEIPIWIHAGKQPVNALDVHFNFDPEQIQIQSIKGIKESGWIEMQSTFDNKRGTVDYAAVTMGETPGEFVACTVIAKVSTTNLEDIDLEFVYKPITRKTRVEYNANDVCKGNVTISD